ncbi:hypothetical protein Avbf_14973, partial [Armadillidium vulgare]
MTRTEQQCLTLIIYIGLNFTFTIYIDRYVTKSRKFHSFLSHTLHLHSFIMITHTIDIELFQISFYGIFPASLFMETLYGKVLVHRIMELGECTSLAINLMF